MAEVWDAKGLLLLTDLMTKDQREMFYKTFGDDSDFRVQCRLASYILTHGCAPKEVPHG